jgi:hypothetical protein
MSVLRRYNVGILSVDGTHVGNEWNSLSWNKDKRNPIGWVHPVAVDEGMNSALRIREPVALFGAAASSQTACFPQSGQ